MTENTPKKPRRKRRTKAQIEADKAAKLEEKQKEETVVEKPVETVKPATTKPNEEPYIELTGLAKIRQRVATRKYRDIRWMN